MGANVTRVDPRTGQQRTYYKADDGKLYQNYAAAVKARQGGSIGFAGQALQAVAGDLQGNASQLVRKAAGAALNLLPARFNLFGRYVTGVGNANLRLSPETQKAIRRTTEIYPNAPASEPGPFGRPRPPEFSERGWKQEQKRWDAGRLPGPGQPQPGPRAINSYASYATAPLSVTNTLGRFNVDVTPDRSIRVRDTYDMANEFEDRDLLSGRSQPGKAFDEIQRIWNPAAPLPPPPGSSYPAAPKLGDSPTTSPMTRLGRAALYLLPVKPEPYEIDLQIPYR